MGCCWWWWLERGTEGLLRWVYLWVKGGREYRRPSTNGSSKGEETLGVVLVVVVVVEFYLWVFVLHFSLLFSSLTDSIHLLSTFTVSLCWVWYSSSMSLLISSTHLHPLYLSSTHSHPHPSPPSSIHTLYSTATLTCSDGSSVLVHVS